MTGGQGSASRHRSPLGAAPQLHISVMVYAINRDFIFENHEPSSICLSLVTIPSCPLMCLGLYCPIHWRLPGNMLWSSPIYPALFGSLSWPSTRTLARLLIAPVLCKYRHWLFDIQWLWTLLWGLFSFAFAPMQPDPHPDSFWFAEIRSQVLIY